MSEPLRANNLPGDGEPKPVPPEHQEPEEQTPLGDEISVSLEQNIQFFWRSVTRGKYLIVALSLTITFLVYLYCKMQTPVYLAESKVLIEPPATEAGQIVGMDQRGELLESDILTEKDIILSRVVAERAVQNLNLKEVAPFKTSQDPTGLLLSLLKVEATTKSRALRVRALFTDPMMTANIANEVLNAYSQISEEKAKTWIMRTVDQMRSEVTRLKRKLDEDQHEVERYEAGHPQIASRDALDGQVKHLNEELATVSGERLKLRTELEELAAFQKQGADVRDHPKIAKDPTIEPTVNILQQKRVELTQLLSIYKEGFPIVIEKRNEIQTLEDILGQRKAQIIEDLKSKYIQLAAREHEVRKAMAQKSEELSALLGEIGGYEALVGEVEVSKNLYSMLLDRLDKAGIMGRAEQSKIKILSRAEVPQIPYSPQTERNVALAFALSLTGSAYFVYLFFLMLKPIESEEEIVQGLNIPVLAEVPHLRRNKDQPSELLVDQEADQGKDALHFLRAALVANDRRTMVFTSANPGEGKTFMVRNLGVYLAREGWKVLLVGTDLRDLRLKAHLKLDINSGSLEEYLGGKCDIQQVIHPCREPKLFYLGSEKTMKNAVEVVGSPRFQDLIRQLSSQFDFTLLDSPPVRLFADAKILVQSAKDVVFVVRHGKTPYRDLHKSVTAMQKNGAHVVGAILNGKTLGWHNYYYYNYYYGKGSRTSFFKKIAHGAGHFAGQLQQIVERRKHNRSKTTLSLEISHKIPSGEKYKFWAVGTDVSEGGMLVEFWNHSVSKEYKAQDFKDLDLNIKLPNDEHIIAKGKVVRVVSVGKQIRLGIEFSEISDQDREKIKRLLVGS